MHFCFWFFVTRATFNSSYPPKRKIVLSGESEAQVNINKTSVFARAYICDCFNIVSRIVAWFRVIMDQFIKAFQRSRIMKVQLEICKTPFIPTVESRRPKMPFELWNTWRDSNINCSNAGENNGSKVVLVVTNDFSDERNHAHSQCIDKTVSHHQKRERFRKQGRVSAEKWIEKKRQVNPTCTIK